MAAYDPVFYLHHSNVDRQYAFWQELQKLRGYLSTEAISKDFSMPPFWDQRYNPDPIYKVTGKNATQSYGLNYETNFNYKYDKLTFEGDTPEEFYQKYNSHCTDRSMAVIVVRNATATRGTSSQPHVVVQWK